MAINKMNTIGTKKSILNWLLWNKKCAICKLSLKFTEMQIDHVTSKRTMLVNGETRDDSFGNLASLCKPCNSTKNNSCIEFYEMNNLESYKFLLGFQKLSSGITDLRNLVKLRIRNCDGQLITKEVLSGYCDAYAQKYPTSKFSKLHRVGLFHKLSSTSTGTN